MSRIYLCRMLPVLLTLAVDLPAQTAAATAFGEGCYSGRRSFYEMFGTTTSFDLSGTTLQPGGFSLLSIGTQFLVLPLAASWHMPGPAAVPLPLSDDSLTSVSLGFALPLPTGSSSQWGVCSNGFLYPHAGTSTQFSPTVPGLLGGDERLAICFTDLNPTLGGRVLFEATPLVSYLTFDNVVEFGGTGTATFQVAFRPFGQIDVLYGPITIVNKARLVGYSPGGGAIDPGPRDLSLGATFLTDFRDEESLALVASGRPVLGTSMQLSIARIPVGGVGALLAIGAQQFPTGVDLGAFGMSGCNQYVSFDDVTLFPTAASSFGTLIAVPSAPSLLGVTAYAQAAASAPGRNSLQWVSSNGIALFVGAQ